VENSGVQQESYLDLVYSLDRFSSDLMKNLQRFITVEDTSGVGTIWSSCIACLAHLAALSHLVSQTNPDSSAYMNGLCNLTLGQLGNLSIEVHVEGDGYSDFDLLIGVRILFVAPDEVRRSPNYST
jgi:hypothetical protein